MACVCSCVEGVGEEHGILKDKVALRAVGGGEGGGVRENTRGDVWLRCVTCKVELSL